MKEKTVICKAIENYLIQLNFNTSNYDVAMLNTAKKCLDYLYNGGVESVEWIKDNNYILSTAINIYHQQLDDDIREAKIISDGIELIKLREERKQLLKIKNTVLGEI